MLSKRLLGIALLAATLRTAVGALSPIIGVVGADVPLTDLSIGVLGALPPLCFGLFGLLTPILRRRISLETLALLALAGMLCGHVVRAAAASAGLLVSMSALIFAAAGIANVVLPPLVKQSFPARIGIVTSVYVTLMTTFSLLPPLVAVPVARAGGWRVAVGMWGALCLIAIFPWLPLRLRAREIVAPPSLTGLRPMWRSRLGWCLAILFAMTAANVFAMFAWLPKILVDTAGVSAGQAGALLSLYAAVGVPLALLVPQLATRLRHLGVLIAIGFFCYLAGYLGLAIAPTRGTVGWVVLIGLGPLLFPLTLTLINLRTRTTAGATALSGLTQGAGYLLGGLGPLALGVTRQLTGSWTVPLALLLATLPIVAVTGYLVSRPTTLEDSP
ncbi:MFS transporter [Fodinicola feengrottensis]|uniref:MFS transporter n=1 Tax=Fodinicola feengrottensis TaxID=435914 RepID=A0ABN2JC48_9ACTN|nr:MFS transporter [Fodinicola feengrottensis]